MRPHVALFIVLFVAMQPVTGRAAPWSTAFGLDPQQALDVKGLTLLPDGDIAVVARAAPDGDPGTVGDALVARFDPDGMLRWARTYGGGEDERPEAIVARPDGVLVVTGSTRSWGRGMHDLWVFGLLANGDLAWQNVVGHSSSDHVFSAIARADGMVQVVGACVRPGGTGDLDGWLVTVDAQGRPTEETFGGPGSDSFWEIAAASDGSGVLLAGVSDVNGTGVMYNTFVRVDARGDILWQSYFTQAFTLQGLGSTADGGFLATGYMSVSGRDWDLVIFKLLPTGEQALARVLQSPGDERGVEVLELPGGNVLVAGYTDALGGSTWLIELDAYLNVIRERVIGSERSERPAGARRDADGSLLLAGSIGMIRSPSHADGWLARVENDWSLPSCSATSLSYLEGIPPGQSFWSALDKSRPFGQGAPTDALVGSASAVRLEPCGVPCGLTVPGEISGPPWTTPLRVGGRGLLSWDDSRRDCERYTLHRGRVSALRAGDRGACLASDLLVARYQDDEDPGLGEAWFYLIAAASDAGEGSLGNDSLGARRPNPTPCP